MSWVRFPILLLLGTVGVSLGLATVRTPIAIAPNEHRTHPLWREVESYSSLSELYGLRDRITQELQTVSNPAHARDMASLKPYLTLAQLNYAVHQQIQMEEDAAATYKQALELAAQGRTVQVSERSPLQALEQEEALWDEAVQRLESIPPDSLVAAQATKTLATYQRKLTTISQQVNEAQSSFLQPIAEATGLGSSVHITICHISGECRSYQGDSKPASPASLIKLPIAVVLMEKVTQDKIDLDTQIYVAPHNFTENADGATVGVDRKYSLKQIMAAMIRESNNIATNQLIDYLGWNFINQTLRDRGFPKTSVHTKLVGDSTYPTRNMGNAANTTTTNELAEMMRQIYTLARPGDEEVLDALVGQYDHDFGYTALQEFDQKRVSWIGEKLGQNNKAIGTTVAVKIDGERYMIAAIIDNSANEAALRQIIQDVVKHVMKDGSLIQSEQAIADPGISVSLDPQAPSQ